MKNSSEKEQPKVKKTNKTGANIRPWLMLALILALFASTFRMGGVSQDKKELTQAAFLRCLQDGVISDPISRVVDHEEDETYLTGEIKLPAQDDREQKVEKFKVPLVWGESSALMDALTNQGINIKIEEVKKSIWSGLFMQIFSLVLFFGLFYFVFFRRVGGAGPFGMGKSKAKILNGKEGLSSPVCFKDVAGVDEAKEEVQEIVEFLKEPAAFQKLGGKIPKGVLLVGPPGTGKTLLAKAIAGEAKVPFFAMSGSDFEEMFVGVGASRMRDIFSEAKKQSPCIIFIDEIDSIGMKRTGAGALGGSHSYEQTLNTMLVEMDGFSSNDGVIVIAATNRPDTLDSALMRPGRFDRQVYIDLPTLKGREEILRLHGKRIKFSEDADLKRVARGTPGFSGADLANLLNEAALLAVRKKLEAVDMKTLDEARDKVLWGRERKSSGYSQKDRETTAWHEAGHALLQVLLPDTDPIHKVTIIPRGRALGATMSLPEADVLNHTKKYFDSLMAVCCGGRIAEEIFTGDISTGASQDIRQATQIAREMICRFGMSERFGFQAFQEPSQFTGEELSPAFSEKTSEAIDEEVRKMIDEAYAKATKLIHENRDKLETLAKTLLEKETMDGSEVEAIIKV